MSELFDLAWAESIRNVGQAAFSMESATATQFGYIDPEIIDNIDLIPEVLGRAEAAGDGRIHRELPLAHPEYPWLFATGLQNEGISFLDKVDSEPGYEAQPVGAYAIYSRYRIRIDYVSRPYLVLGDDSIPFITIYYYTRAGTSTSKSVPAEWWRFTDYDIIPAAEFLTASQGTYTFDRSDEAPPHGNTVPGEIKLLQNKKVIKFKWFQVPYSYVSSDANYLDGGLGKVNQLDWYGWSKGTLLFLSYSMRRYTPPNPGTDPWDGGVIANTKLCDIEFNFLYFNPGELTGGAAPTPPDNASHITAGHNLQPWSAGANNGYYYAKADPLLENTPVFESYPFQLFFLDPETEEE